MDNNLFNQHQNTKDLLVIKSLGKKYAKGFWGLSDFSLNLKPGILGLLGPNGAGKSSLMRIIATISKPTTGEIYWCGENVIKNPEILRTILGYLPQDFGVYPNLNAFEFLEYIASIKGFYGPKAHKKINELIDLLNLRDAAKRPLGGFSGGMKQRVGIAQALLNDPKLLIVDEPTVGLDPEERVRFRNLLSDLSGERIVILSTHIVSDVESTATEIAMMNLGQLITRAQPETLLQQVEGQVWEWIDSSENLPKIKQQFLVSGTIRKNNGIQVRVVSPQQPSPNAHSVSPNLEDVYLYKITKSNGASL